MQSRTCGTCTACCEGWLTADVRGHMMRPGQPCYYLKNGACSDYVNRPAEPCQSYTCAWLTDPQFPDWLKPNLARVIISRRQVADPVLDYWEVIETGSTIDSAVLNWIMRWAIGHGVNITYQVAGQHYTLGSREFIQYTATL